MSNDEEVIELTLRAKQELLGKALSAEEHQAFVAALDDPDLATT
jgi:hypothetical protein